MMKKEKIKRITAFLICFIMIFSMAADFLAIGVRAEDGLALKHDGIAVGEIIISKNDTYKLETDAVYADYRWQIFKSGDSENGNGFWVTIQGCTESSLNVTYALIRSLLDGDKKAKIRLCATDKTGTEKVSETVEIYVAEGSANREEVEIEETQSAKANLDSNSSQTYTLVSDETNVKEEPLGTDEVALASSVEEFAINEVAVASEEELEYVTVTINYNFKTGGIAFDPYVATLVKGTSFMTTVVTPSIMGYDPVISGGDGGGETAKEISINYPEGVTENVTINVIYQPALVNYTVSYFFQNIFDDLYSENTALAVLNGKGYTGEYPDPSYFQREYEGFSLLTNDREEIAADGSSHYSVFYNRNYYLLNFILDGGYGVEPIYAKYGSSFVANTPIKHGYMFAGWDLLKASGDGDGVADTLSDKIPAGNRTYKALWKAEDTTYQVVYWKENPDDAGYSYWGTERIAAVSSYPVSGSDRAAAIGLPDSRYFKYDDEKTEKNVIVDGDGSTVVNVYYSRNVYTMKYYFAKSVPNGNTITHYIAGGTTWPFATCGSSDISTMLSAVGSWGAVEKLPELNSVGLARGYVTGSEVYNNQTYYYFQFSAKYGADISQLWPVGVLDSVKTSQTNDFGDTAYFSAWNVEHKTYYSQYNTNKTLKGNYLRLDHQLLYDPKYEDAETIRFLAFWENGADNVGWNKPNKWIYNIYLPVLGEEKYDIIYDEVNYKLYATYELYDDNTSSSPQSQTATAVEGFTNFTRVANLKEVIDSNYGISAYTIDFYYTRNEYVLEFTSHDKVVKKQEGIPYEESLANYFFTPAYPETLEVGAYEFGGWYTSPGCYDGTEVDWTSFKMPANDLMLYAKWSPRKHTVKVYETYADASSETNLYSQFEIQHRNTVNPPASFKEPEKQGYTFMGWFYIDQNGDKVAFNFQDVAVTKDLVVFADWSSDIVVSYEINYVFIDEDGNRTVIADKTSGQSFAGNTKTFKAKAANDLYESYRTHYYPKTNNHSIFMSERSDANIFTFEYIYLDKVPYTVRYVNKVTGETLMEEKYVADNEAAVISEKFEYIKDFVPDAYYKRLILSGNEDENVITFYYVPDSQHAYYAVHHYTQNQDKSGYSEYAVIEGVGDIGLDITADVLSISGFGYNGDISTATGKITEKGLSLELYYDRKIYDYTINYLEYGTNKKLADPKTGAATYGTPIKGEAIAIDGYNLIGEDEITIEVKDKASLNVINFYYKLPEIKIQYKVVVDGTKQKETCNVSMSQEVVYSSDAIKGSYPIVTGSYYKFEGWYADKDCKTKVDDSFLGLNNTLIPELLSATYYAKFIPKLGSITISNVGADMEKDAKQVFLYSVKGIDGTQTEEVNITVAVKGNEKVTIGNVFMGEYEVSELSAWSYRYTPDKQGENVTLSADGQNVTVEFNETRSDVYWLDGNGYCANVFG